jgi:hypothetical protein
MTGLARSATVSATFVPQPVITAITLSGWTVLRYAVNATIPTTVQPGMRAPGAFTFDLGTTPGDVRTAVSDDCGGAVVELQTVASTDGRGSGSFVWIAPEAASACLVQVVVEHELRDPFSIGVQVVQ